MWHGPHPRRLGMLTIHSSRAAECHMRSAAACLAASAASAASAAALPAVRVGRSPVTVVSVVRARPGSAAADADAWQGHRALGASPGLLPARRRDVPSKRPSQQRRLPRRRRTAGPCRRHSLAAAPWPQDARRQAAGVRLLGRGALTTALCPALLTPCRSTGQAGRPGGNPRRHGATKGAARLSARPRLRGAALRQGGGGKRCTGQGLSGDSLQGRQAGRRRAAGRLQSGVELSPAAGRRRLNLLQRGVCIPTQLTLSRRCGAHPQVM